MGLSAYSNAKVLEISAKLVNKNLYLTVKNNTKQDIIINNISEYVNNQNACGVSNAQYAINAGKTADVVPFTVIDMAKCFDGAYIFKNHFNGITPKVIGFYDPKGNYEPNQYLVDWGAYIVTPIVLKFTYSNNQETGVVADIKYLLYKIAE